MWILLSPFHRIYACRNNVLDYTNYFFQMTMKRMTSLEFRLKKIVETRNYLLEEIKHSNLMSEKYKKTCNYLNYVEHLLI